MRVDMAKFAFKGRAPDRLVVEALSSEPGVKPHEPISMLLDTGATHSFIPAEIALRLASEVQQSGSMEVRPYGQEDGPKRPSVDVAIQVGNVGPKVVRAVVVPRGAPILGMNWFNQVDTHYTRKSNIWSLVIEEP